MGRMHQKYQLPSLLSFLPNHYFLQKVVKVVITGRGRVWKIRIGQSTQFWNVMFCLQGQENTRTMCQFDPCIHVWFYSHILRTARHSGPFVHFTSFFFHSSTPRSSCGGRRTAELFLCMYPSCSASVVFPRHCGICCVETLS